jgi:hypothetical protein
MTGVRSFGRVAQIGSEARNSVIVGFAPKLSRTSDAAPPTREKLDGKGTAAYEVPPVVAPRSEILKAWCEESRAERTERLRELRSTRPSC